MGAYKRFVMQECVSLMMHEVMMLTAKVLALVAAATIETCFDYERAAAFQCITNGIASLHLISEHAFGLTAAS